MTKRAAFGRTHGTLVLAVLVSLGWAAACDSNIERRSSPGEASGTPRASVGSTTTRPEFDVSDVVDRARRAFRLSESGYEARGRGYSVRARGADVAFAARTSPSLESQQLTFRTVAFGREGETVDAALTYSLGQAGSLERHLGPAVETVETVEAGVEQSWQIPAEPAGQGDLVVRISVSGLEYTETTNGGLHFEDPATDLGVSYGHATWIDAAGETVAVPAVFADGAIELVVPDDTVESAAYPVVLDPVIGPEVETDEPVLAVDGTEESTPAVASAGDGTSLVVWEVGQEILGARIDGAGNVLDPKGIVICSHPGQQYSPELAFDGTNFLVVWNDSRGDEATTNDIWGARVSAAGQVLDPEGIHISSGTGAETNPDITFDGTNFLVVWVDTRGAATTGNDIYGSRVSPAGVDLDATDLPLITDASHQVYPAVDSVGGSSMLVWQDLRNAGDGFEDDLYGARISAAGVSLDGNGFVISSQTKSEEQPAIASNGTKYLVAWEDSRNINSTRWNVYGALLAADGTVEASSITLCTDSGDQVQVKVASDGEGWLVGWTDTSAANNWNIEGKRVSELGSVSDNSSRSFNSGSSDQMEGGLAHNGTDWVVVAQDHRLSNLSTSGDIFANYVGETGAALPAFAVSSLWNTQDEADVATDGSTWLVVWEDRRNASATGDDIYAVRVDSSGSVLDGTALSICEEEGGQEYPRVDFDGANFLIVWRDGRPGANAGTDLYGARVTPSGVILDEGGFVIDADTGSQGTADVSCDGTSQCLAVWQDTRNYGTTKYDIWANLVSTTGVPGTSFVVSDAIENQEWVEAAFNGTDWLVVWEDDRANSAPDIYGARVTTAGAVTDPAGIAISTDNEEQQFPSVAAVGGQWLVAWHDTRNYGSTSWDIYATRVLASGALSDAAGFAVASGIGVEQRPRVASDGIEWLVAWQDARNSASTGADIYAARVDATGTIPEDDVGGFPLLASEAGESSPRFAAGSNGSYRFVYKKQWGARTRTIFRQVDTVCIPSAADDVTCDNVDDDCDGNVDEDYVSESTACGEGVCASTGSTTCEDGSALDSCTPLPEPDGGCNAAGMGGMSGTGGDTMGTGGDASAGDGDGDASAGDGDGDASAGDGDGDASAGDGDGDASAGDGDGDASAGDGDGDGSAGDGDGDGDGDGESSDSSGGGDSGGGCSVSNRTDPGAGWAWLLAAGCFWITIRRRPAAPVSARSV